MAKIDLKKLIRFYDDRGKDKDFYYPHTILYHDKKVALMDIEEEEGTLISQCETGTEEDEQSEAPILFLLSTGEVLNERWGSWIAENYKEKKRTPLL